MMDKEQNKSEVHQEPISKDIAGMNSRGKDRRRFIKRAIVAAPFILTVTSRPVWAANCTMSGQLSGNLSDAGEPCCGQGCSPGYWKNHETMWHPKFQPTSFFEDVFGMNPFNSGPINLHEVMLKYKSPTDPVEPLVLILGFHAIAALQNAATAVPFDLTVDQVISEVNAAYTNYGSSGDAGSALESLKNDLDYLNNQGCPY